jgi:gas vesicle protein
MSTQKILAGALAGIMIGILIAPAKGSETRQKISETADNLKEKLRRLRGTTNNELDELRQLIEREATGLKEDTRQKILKLIETTKKGFNHLKEDALAN